MKKYLIALFAVALCSCTFNVNTTSGKIVRCKGPIQEKTLEELTGFNNIVVQGSADIFLVQQPECKVTVRANEEVFQYLDYVVEDGTLIIQNKDRVNVAAETYDITICLPSLSAITVNGAADVKWISPYTSEDDMAIKVNGAGDLELGGVSVPSLSIVVNGAGDVDASSLDVDTLAITVNGAGDVLVSGVSDTAFFKVNGAGMIDARKLDCEAVETKRAGVAVIRLKD